MEDRFRIRPATADDLRVVARLEAQSFRNPWPGSEFFAFLDAVFLVGEEGEGGIVGFAIGRAVADEGEVLNLAVAPWARRRGIGRRLLVALLDRLAEKGVNDVYLEVRASNSAAMAMYRNHGFQAVGERARYYRNPPENAVVMHRPGGR